ncbi:cytosolic thiouridylase subunit Ctu1 [Savitreella phatthalungensis]
MAPSKLCDLCGQARPQMVRPKTSQRVCKSCFFAVFELEVHTTITRHRLFRRGERVGIGASGGKDSTVLAHLMTTLNGRYDYGLDLYLVSIDEGIKGYRDDSLATVHRNAAQYGLPLKIVSYEQLYGGWSMDRIVQQIGRKGNCTYCGVLRRQALDRAAASLGLDALVTGHNADDVAETVLMNLLRGDVARLSRCVDITTGQLPGDGTAHPLDAAPSCAPADTDTTDDLFLPLRRSKPLFYAYEKEIVLYAHYKGLDYFSTECTYSPEAFRGTARALVKELERLRPRAILDLIYSGHRITLSHHTITNLPKLERCAGCGYLTSDSRPPTTNDRTRPPPICKACMLLRGLNDAAAATSTATAVAKPARQTVELEMSG